MREDLLKPSAMAGTIVRPARFFNPKEVKPVAGLREVVRPPKLTGGKREPAHSLVEMVEQR